VPQLAERSASLFAFSAVADMPANAAINRKLAEPFDFRAVATGERARLSLQGSWQSSVALRARQPPDSPDRSCT
jgi:hypothetical protein